jgi:hypothetical protein
MIDRARRPAAIPGVALVAICWPIWWFAGMLAACAGIGDLDLVVRIVAIFAFLTLVETASGRLTGT